MTGQRKSRLAGNETAPSKSTATDSHQHKCGAPERVGVDVSTADIGRYGALAAYVLACIRSRCAADVPCRVVDDDGARWCQVSQVNLGREFGLSRMQVRAALKSLEGVVSVRSFSAASSRALAYRAEPYRAVRDDQGRPGARQIAGR